MIKYFCMLDKNDVEKICETIPYSQLQYAFKKLPGDFAKVCKGYRPQGLPEEKGRKLLSSNMDSQLTLKIIENFAISFLKEIDEVVESENLKRIGKDEKYFISFSKSKLPNCADIYFKLKQKKVSTEYITALNAGVNALKHKMISERRMSDEIDLLNNKTKEINEQIQKKDSFIKEKNNEISDLKSNIVNLQTLLDEKKIFEDKLKELNEKISFHEHKEVDLNKKIKELQNICEIREMDNVELQKKYTVLKEENMISQSNVASMNKEIERVDEKAVQLKQQLDKCEGKCIILEQELEKSKKQQSLHKYSEENLDLILSSEKATTIMPKDIDEFKEFIQYNLESISGNGNKDTLNLLVDYIGNILFNGKPIVLNMLACKLIVDIISNAAFNGERGKTLKFKPDITDDVINEIIIGEDKIIVLENFLGNFDETRLLSLLNNAKNKIVFLSVVYDKTLAFLPPDIMRYCNYLNIDCLGVFLQGYKITEDKSSVEMQEGIPEWQKEDRKTAKFCQNIMREIGFEKNVIDIYTPRMNNKRTLIENLLFSFLPYSLIVGDICVFNKSRKILELVKNDSVNKDIFLRWFGND